MSIYSINEISKGLKWPTLSSTLSQNGPVIFNLTKRFLNAFFAFLSMLTAVTNNTITVTIRLITFGKET